MLVMNLKIFKLVLILVIFICTNSFANTNIKRIAVLDFTAVDLPQSYAQVFRNKIEMYLYQTNKFDIIEQSRVMNALQGEKIILGQVMSQKDAIRIGQSIAAEYIVLGDIYKAEKYKLSIRMVNIKKGKIVFSDIKSFDTSKQLLNSSSLVTKNIVDFIENLIFIKKEDTSYSDTSYKFYSALYTGYSKPLKDFANILKPGIANSLILGGKNIFFDNFILGIETGYNYYNASGNADYAVVVPILGHIAYSVPLFNNFQIIPGISFGYSYNSLYSENSTRSDFEAMIKYGASINYSLTTNIDVSFRTVLVNLLENELRYTVDISGGFVFNL